LIMKRFTEINLVKRLKFTMYKIEIHGKMMNFVKIIIKISETTSIYYDHYSYHSCKKNQKTLKI